jgi:oxygen-independent coproporphyrinogen-3 oxidase
MAGLYIHIPFCGSRCGYCDFYSSCSPGSIAGFLEALEREMKTRRGFFEIPALDTIYIGGGTPSLLSPAQLGRILRTASELWDCSGLREVTVEANPEDMTPEWLAGLAAGTGSTPSEGYPKGGVVPDRLSIGIQSFDDDILRMMNRRHDAQRARQAVKSARRAGFDNISTDLIFGIPGMSQEQWERTIDETLAMGPEHISAYHLTIEPGTPFGKRARRDEENNSPAAFRPIPEAESERQFQTLREKLAGAGFEHYEISNFAIPGRRAVHNSAYWSGEPYLGLGPSAHSFDGAGRREWVLPDVTKYISAAGTDAIRDGETLTGRERRNEKIMTALRTSGGILLDEFERRFGTDHLTRLRLRAGKLLAAGLLVEEKNPATFRLPPEKWLLADYITAKLFES